LWSDRIDMLTSYFSEIPLFPSATEEFHSEIII
jgi:hypothetical protein